jgi:hypothetical protein
MTGPGLFGPSFASNINLEKDTFETPKKRFSAEQIVVRLRQPVLMSQGKAAPPNWAHRSMAEAFQHQPAALALEIPASPAHQHWEGYIWITAR